MTARFTAATHPGRSRKHNEDAYGHSVEHGIAVIADGMGGLARGEMASRAVVDTVLEGAGRGLSPTESLRAAHKHIAEASGSAVRRMGATAVVLTVHGSDAVLSWVGDSRAYLWRDGTLRAQTRDHSFVQELLDAGAISAAEAEVHPNRNIVTRAVGVRDMEHLDVDEERLDLRVGDRLLLCSDGLHGYLPHNRMAELCARHADDSELVEALIRATLDETEAGDNITVLCASLR